MYKTGSKKPQHSAETKWINGFSEATIKLCRNLLIDLARSGKSTSYGDLATRLGIQNQFLSSCLERVADDEQKAGRPDLTAILHYAGRKYGRIAPRSL
jgi:hypothetical protein